MLARTINSMAKVSKTLRSRIELEHILDLHAYDSSRYQMGAYCMVALIGTSKKVSKLERLSHFRDELRIA